MAYKSLLVYLIISCTIKLVLTTGEGETLTDPTPTEALDYFIKCWKLLFLASPVPSVPGHAYQESVKSILAVYTDYYNTMTKSLKKETEIISSLTAYQATGKRIDDDLKKIIFQNRDNLLAVRSKLLKQTLERMAHINFNTSKAGKKEQDATQRMLDDMKKHPHCYVMGEVIGDNVHAMRSIGVQLQLQVDVEPTHVFVVQTEHLPKHYKIEMLELLLEIKSALNEPQRLQEIYAKRKPFLDQLPILMWIEQLKFSDLLQAIKEKGNKGEGVVKSLISQVQLTHDKLTAEQRENSAKFVELLGLKEEVETAIEEMAKFLYEWTYAEEVEVEDEDESGFKQEGKIEL